MQVALKIDDRGDIVSLDHCSARIERTFKASPLSSLLDTELDRGFAYWSQTAGWIVIAFDPLLLAPPTLERLASWLKSRTPQRCLICTRTEFDGRNTWRHEIAPSAQVAIAKIQQCVLVETGGTGIRYKRELQTLEAAARHQPWVDDLARLWHHEAQTGDPLQFWEKLSTVTDDAFYVFEADHAKGFLLHSCGREVSDYALRWFRTNTGRPVLEAPHAAYGAASNRSFMDAHALGRPSVDHIDTIVHWPTIGQLRHKYLRMLLPLSVGQHSFLVSVTRLEPGCSAELRRRQK
ncbi:MAG: hypothetical protein HOO99_11460 [Hyphomicrobiaceae bacterium]|nr:hypothetical protein [Hyphomicrobiaceae bacterium]